MRYIKVCPNCEREVEAIYTIFTKEMIFRSETFTVRMFGFLCSECKEFFDDPENSCDELDQLYRKYRKKHGRMQPEEFVAGRKKLGLTCQEFAGILGISSLEYRGIELGSLIDIELENRIKEMFDAKCTKKVQS